MRVLPTYVCSNHLLRFSTGVVQSFPGIRLLILVDTLKVHFCDVRECASGGIKSVSHDLRTTGSKMKEVVHISLRVQRQVVSISGTRKSTRRRGVFAEDSTEGCHGPPKAANCRSF